MSSSLTIAFLLIALAVGGFASAEDWTIAKDAGAYRVNGCRLTADGRLVSASGSTARVLSRQQLDEIGAAIDRYESGHSSPYASPAVAGPTKTSAAEAHPFLTTPVPMSPSPAAFPDGGPDWPEGYPRSEYNLAHKDEIVAREAERLRAASWRPSYMREGLTPLLFMAGIFLGLLGKTRAVSAVCAGLWLGQILVECQLYGDRVLGAFLTFSLMNAFVGGCFLLGSYVCLGGAKLFSNAFPAKPPQQNEGNGRWLGHRNKSSSHGIRRRGADRE